jgi:phosphatidylinositol alpha-mannosyltransferase
VRVLICGKGPLQAKLENYVQQHHLGHVVHFTGYVSEAEKPAYLASADIAVFPSTGGESFGIVLIEAMAAGAKVVLGGDNVGYQTVLGERPDQLISLHHSEAFAKQLHHFIRSSRARQNASKWQAKAVQQYDTHVVGQQLLALYEQALLKIRANLP